MGLSVDWRFLWVCYDIVFLWLGLWFSGFGGFATSLLVGVRLALASDAWLWVWWFETLLGGCWIWTFVLLGFSVVLGVTCCLVFLVGLV